MHHEEVSELLMKLQVAEMASKGAGSELTEQQQSSDDALQKLQESLEAVRGTPRRRMGCPPARWPESPRIVMQCVPMSIK